MKQKKIEENWSKFEEGEETQAKLKKMKENENILNT